MNLKSISRRLLVPVLILVVAVSCMTVSALADDPDSSLINLMDYGVVQGTYFYDPDGGDELVPILSGTLGTHTMIASEYWYPFSSPVITSDFISILNSIQYSDYLYFNGFQFRWYSGGSNDSIWRIIDSDDYDLRFVIRDSSFTLVSRVGELENMDFVIYGPSSYFPVQYSFDVPLPFSAPVSYVDFTLLVEGGSLDGASVGSSDLSVIHISDNLYRVFGTVGSGFSDTLPIYLDFSGAATYRFNSFYISILPEFSYPELGSIMSDKASGGEVFKQETFDSVAACYFDMGPEYWTEEYYLQIWCDNWDKYDYIDFTFAVYADTIQALSVVQDDKLVPFEYGFLDSNTSEWNNVNVNGGVELQTQDATYCLFTVRINVSELDRTGSIPYIILSGTYSNLGRYAFLYSTVGSVASAAPDPIGSFFNDLKDFLSDLFGGEEEKQAVQDAIKDQETINVELNNQIADSVDSWNVNITFVEDGFDTATANTWPAVVWLSNLANDVFFSMGWFGSIYLVVGMMSIILLLLSKSGLAGKISHKK